MRIAISSISKRLSVLLMEYADPYFTFNIYKHKSLLNENFKFESVETY